MRAGCGRVLARGEKLEVEVVGEVDLISILRTGGRLFALRVRLAVPRLRRLVRMTVAPTPMRAQAREECGERIGRAFQQKSPMVCAEGSKAER
jgi:hypothetical protein